MLDIIKGFRKNNVHFDIMILKTWFRDEAVIKRVKQTPFGNHMSMAYCFSYDEGDYGVDIEKYLSEIKSPLYLFTIEGVAHFHGQYQLNLMTLPARGPFN